MGGNMAGKFELGQAKNGQFSFSLKAGNGQTILVSEQYKDKAGAKNGIESVKKNAPDDSKYERKTSKKGEPYFVLKAANGQVIGTSEMYSSAAAMEGGIASVKQNGPGAEVVDLTAK
jgi:uncharacterized protein YegP (UPF0339 family)